MLSSTERVRSKRAAARKQGLCVTCCKVKPPRGLLVCGRCKTATNARRKIRLEAEKRTKELRRIVEQHERLGDLSTEHYLHEDAAQHYQHALNVASIAEEDRLRVMKKLQHELSLGKNPTSAIPLVESLLGTHASEMMLGTLPNAEWASDRIRMLRHRASLLFLEGRLSEAVDLMLHAMHLADASDDVSVRRRTRLSVAAWLCTACRPDEAKHWLDTVTISSEDDSSFRMSFHRIHGSWETRMGNMENAYAHYDKAVEAAEKSNDAENIVGLWHNYSFCAWVFGDTVRDKACCERALLLARRFGLICKTAEACISYADTLALLGQDELARRYLLEALSYDVHAPRLNYEYAEAGIPIALSVNDEEMLAKCADLKVLEAYFRSDEYPRIASLANAFAYWYFAKGNTGKAQALLRHAVQALRPLKVHQRITNLWPLCISIAWFGKASDISAARTLLRAHSILPLYHDMETACTELFEAFVMSRRKQTAGSIKHARSAFQRFTAAGWQKYARLARILLPADDAALLAVERTPTHSSVDILLDLTPREREIAQFLLDGVTNREIARKLLISKYTVESHVASIMNRLGIRSRHQLASVLPERNEPHP